jgi:hypothetical protein
MRSPAAAIAWEFWQRHRWGLGALAGYLAVLAAMRPIILARGQAVTFDSQSFAFFVFVPLCSMLTYLLAVFTYGLSGDLAARQSMYPARIFTMPASTSALAGWPMLYGALTMAIFWLAIRLLAVWPSGFAAPWVWPALLAAVMLCWTQALTWMPYGLPGLRIIVTVLWLSVIDTIVLLALHFEAREAVMLAILAPQVPLGYFAARFAVARARRGVVPDWRGAFTWFGRIAKAMAGGRRRDSFTSPAGAQVWFEWRRHGRSLPVLVGILLPFELALLFAAGDAPVLVFVILLGVLLTPPFMAVFVAATVRKASADVSDSYGVTPFLATRPLTSPALIAAKLKMAILSTLAAWLLVFIAIPTALALSDTWPMVMDKGRDAIEFMGTPRTIVLLLVIILGFMASTWKQLVQTLYIGLTGRDWIVKSNVFLTLVFVSALGPVADWVISNGRVRAALWDAIPWILAVLVAVKMSAAIWVAVRLYGSRLLSDRRLVVGAAIWCVTVLALYGVFAWFLSTPFFPHYLLVLVAILAIPLARLSAAPLVLAWNRHR